MPDAAGHPDPSTGDLATELGVRRCLEPPGVTPQAAWRLDNRPDLWPGERRVDVELVALDPVWMRRLRDACEGDGPAMRRSLLETLAERGKLHDPVTGAGGTLVGRLGGVLVALPSGLSTVPLWLTGVAGWDGRTPTVPADGYAVVFPRTPLVPLPDDLDVRVALAALDAAPAVGLVLRTVTAGAHVAVLGGATTAGALASVAAREGGADRVAATVSTLEEARLVERVGAADPVVADVGDPLRTATALRARLDGPAAVTAVCGDAPGAEGAALLTTAQDGVAVFTTLATSFPDLVTEARRLHHSGTLLVGGGHAPGEADHALDLVRTWPALRQLVAWRAGAGAHPLDAEERV